MRVFTQLHTNFAAGPPVLEWSSGSLRVWLNPPGPATGDPRTTTLLSLTPTEASDLANAVLDALANRPQSETA